MILVKFEHNYADEYDVIGYTIMDVDEYFTFIDAAHESFRQAKLDSDTITSSWGGNDCIEFESYDDWRTGITPKEISQEDASALIKTLGRTYGHCCYAEY